jgi:hypothetical protein
MKKISIFLFALMAATFASAQFDVSVLGSLPTGDFADDAGRDGDGYAKFGFGASAGYFIETGVEGLGIYPSIGFIYNSSDLADEISKNLRQSAQQQNIQANFDGEGGNYITIPLTIGPSYKGEVGDGFYVYGTGHIGIGLNIISTLEVSASEQNFNYSSEIETNSPVSFAGGIEGGVILADMWKFGFQFLSLGEPEFEFDQSVTQNGQTQTGNSEGDQPRAMFLIKLGIVLN